MIIGLEVAKANDLYHVGMRYYLDHSILSTSQYTDDYNIPTTMQREFAKYDTTGKCNALLLANQMQTIVNVFDVAFVVRLLTARIDAKHNNKVAVLLQLANVEFDVSPDVQFANYINEELTCKISKTFWH